MEPKVKFLRFMAITLVILLSGLIPAGLALAASVDTSVVDVIAPTGSVTLAPGGSGAITINMAVSGAQGGTATFEVNRDWVLSGGVFTGSSPQTFTVPPRGGGDSATTFTTTGNVSVAAGQGNGSFTLAIKAENITNTGTPKLGGGGPSSYQVTVSAPLGTDATLSDLTVAGTTVTGFAAATLTYNVELAAGTTIVPTVTAAVTDPKAHAVVTPAGSLPGTTTVVVTAEDGSTKKTYTINFTVAAPADTTPPVITPTITGTLGNNDWYVSDVTVRWSINDPESTITSTTGAGPTTLTNDTAGTTLTCTATSAGGTSSASVTIKIDKTAPVITAGAPTGTTGANGWYISDVTVPFSATDNLSGFAPGGALTATLASKTTVGEGAALTVTSDGISDMAGNPAVVVQAGPFKVDWTPPVVTITTGTYLLNQGVSATWTATDTGGSGVVPPSSGPVSVDTSSVGTKTITVPAGTAVDVAGNSSVEARATYYVQYGFNGLLSPYVAPPKTFKMGSSVPLKWQYTDYTGTVVDSSAANPSVEIRLVIAGTTTPTEGEPITVNNPGSSGLRYDSLTMTWQFNWQTKGLATGVYNIYIKSGQSGQSNGPFSIQLK